MKETTTDVPTSKTPKDSPDLIQYNEDVNTGVQMGQEAWSREFDDRFCSIYGYKVHEIGSGKIIMGNTLVEEFKDFIRTLITSETAKDRSDIVKRLQSALDANDAGFDSSSNIRVLIAKEIDRISSNLSQV
jgi:hypothetical protein